MGLRCWGFWEVLCGVGGCAEWRGGGLVAAACRVVGVLGTTPAEELRAAGAEWVVESLAGCDGGGFGGWAAVEGRGGLGL